MSLVEKGIENCHGLSSRPVESRVAAHSSRLSPSPCAYAGTSPALPSIGTEYPYQHVVAVAQNPSTLTKLRGGWSRLTPDKIGRTTIGISSPHVLASWLLPSNLGGRLHGNYRMV